MSALNKIIKDGEVVNNQYPLIDATADESLTISDQAIVPLALWQAREDLQQRKDIGVVLANDVDLEAVAESLLPLPVIAIQFPVFMDGRGFSLARLLRERYGYQGEIRAVGHIIRDQLCYLKRCGFTAFAFDDTDIDLEAAKQSLNDFSEAYQAAVDIPSPLFRRRT